MSTIELNFKSHLNIFVQVSELVHVGQGLDTSPGRMTQEVHWTGHVQYYGISQEEV